VEALIKLIEAIKIQEAFSCKAKVESQTKDFLLNFDVTS
jgi:hypothetical protein